MTVAYVGLPRSGKSYAVVEHQMIPAWRAGRRVVTNIPIFMDKVREIPGLELAELVEFPTTAVKAEPHRLWEFVQKGDVFVLDEVTKLFPNGEKAKDVAPEFLALLSEWGHMVDTKGNSLSVVLVVQDLSMIGSWARGLIEKTLHHTKLTSVGASTAFRCDVYAGSRKGPQYPVKQRETMYVGRYRKEITSLYKSHTMSDSATMGANEKTSDNRTHAAILKRWAVMIGIPGGIIGIFVGFHFLGHAMDKARGVPFGAKASAASAAPIAPLAPGMLQGLGNKAAEIIERPPRYRIVGSIMNDAHPWRSVAVLRQEGDRFPVSVVYSRCRTVDEELQCPLRGWFYSAEGLVGEKSGGAPVGEYVAGQGVVAVTRPPVVLQALHEPDVHPLGQAVGVEHVADGAGSVVAPEAGYGLEVLSEDPVTGRVAFQRPGRYVISHGGASFPKP
jgi:zona occludens toxin